MKIKRIGDGYINNCLTCKLSNDCDFGEGVEKLKEYRGDDNGLGTVVELLIDNINQYIDCESYESK